MFPLNHLGEPIYMYNWLIANNHEKDFMILLEVFVTLLKSQEARTLYEVNQCIVKSLTIKL